MKATVKVMPKASVLDPQGEAVRRAIHSLGMDCVDGVRVGKCIELEISGTNYEKTLAKLEQICEDLLSNPVVEDYGLYLSQPEVPVKSEKPEKKTKKAIAKKTDKKEVKADKKPKKSEAKPKSKKGGK
jgi:phosphoribosylformylglycinamidine synthase